MTITLHASGPLAPDWVPDGILEPPAEEPWLCEGKYLKPEEGKAILDAFLESHNSLEAWESFATRAKTHILAGANLDPMPVRTPLTPVITNEREYDGYRVANIRFQSIPGYWVTGNIYIPTELEPPFAAVLHTHGHSSGIDNPEGWIKHGRFKEDVQMRAAALARMGAVSLTIDMVGYGDSTQFLKGDVHHTPLALTLHIWNALRAIDYLESRDDVDTARIGVTGHSGGGTQAFLLSALDPRVDVCVPVAMVSSWFFGGCECESGQPIHASDGFFMNNAMIAALTAPRPLKLVSDGGDWTVHAPEIEYPFIREIYRLYEKADNLAHTYLADEGHNYGISKRLAMYPFIAEHLGLSLERIEDDKGRITEASLTTEDPELMRNFVTADDLPEGILQTTEAIQSRWDALKDESYSVLEPYDLTVDRMAVPIGVDSAIPTFSWKLRSPERGARQTAWQIQVAASKADLLAGDDLLWDSGRVANNSQLDIPYDGESLQSGSPYWWRLRAWNENEKASSWTSPSHFITGILNPGEWEADWIAHPDWLEFNRPHLGYRSKESPSVNVTKWIQLDLGKHYSVDAVKLHALRHTVAERLGFPMEFKVELSGEEDFSNAVVIADYTGEPYSNSWTTRHTLEVNGIPARYVRITATRLRELNGEICLAFNQIEVISEGRNIAEGAAVSASDSIEEGLWSALAVVDGKGLPDANPVGSKTIVLRREFQLDDAVESALIHVSGLGQYVLYVNGERVGQNKLSPGWTDTEKTVLYETIDVSGLLRKGSNVMALALANGMYTVPDPDGRYTKFIGRFRPLMAILQAEIHLKDGSTERVVTDPQWKTAYGPWTYSHVYGGEDYDARVLDQSWKLPGYDDSNWLSAKLSPDPGGRLLGATHAAPPLRIIDILDPVDANQIDVDTTVYDLGQNASMMLRLKVKGEVGSRVRVFPAELLREDGTVNQSSAAPGKGRTYWEYTLSGNSDTEKWESEFFYQGGRYLQVELMPAEKGGELPAVKMIKGLVVHSSANPAGSFSSSSELWNNTAELIRWAQRSNLMSVLTDCPHRERLGWLEQYHLNGPSLRYHYNLDRLYRKTFQDMVDAQTEAGLVPDIAPEFIVFPGPFRDSPEWGSAIILSAWQQYLFSGDMEVLRNHYHGMRLYFEYLKSKADDYLLDHGLGDWYDLGPANPGLSQLTPIGLTATATFYEDAMRLAQIAEVLGKPEDAESYLSEAGKIRSAFNQKYFHTDAGSYATGSQTANAMPYVLGMVPDEKREEVLNAIIKDIKAHDFGFTSGDVGHAYLLRALAMAGRPDIVYAMHHQVDRPGYGMQLAKGATSLTEAWDASPNNSQNHFMLGHIIEWFYENLVGISPVDESPGFGKIRVRPQPVADITFAEATYDSVRGPVQVSWERSPDLFLLHVTIPANTEAEVHLPVSPTCTVREGDDIIDEMGPVRLIEKNAGHSIFLVPSGSYEFSVTQSK